MLRTRKSLRCHCLHGVLLCFGLGTLAPAAAPQHSQEELQFHSVVPLGIEGFSFAKADRTFYLMASAEQPAFEGLHQASVDSHQVLLDADGHQVNYYPSEVTFRITATTWAEKLSDVPMVRLDEHPDPNQFLLGLRFRLKIFRGLRARIMVPANVRLIGMPADVPYRERVYNLTFRVGKVPVQDRMVLEVFSPTGERLCKFHLDLT